MEVSIAAGEIVGLIYDAFLKQYKDPSSEESLKSLNVLCVRLVFCLYAEDSGIFGKREIFHDYLASFDTDNMRKALIELFEVLDTKPEDRDPYMLPKLAAFPYVNGGLFEDEKIEIPLFTDEIRDLLLNKASADFDWSEISPTIFGAVFESTLNLETRRSGGMHYTSIENIHKVIDSLFLDDLKKGI
ncbi:type IIL restriction-modification enzyme MmeI [[Clostridium] aminophilum]|uniref:type IIL restriction-modification enzyme MmeI n=1 Tax=[Clostridium] aminophilum TaxID=1526 RepID=UPI002FE6C5F2